MAWSLLIFPGMGKRKNISLAQAEPGWGLHGLFEEFLKLEILRMII